MSKKFTALFFTFGLLFSTPTFSNTVMGGEIMYQYLSPNTYAVTLKLFRDCSGITVANTQSICYSSSSLSSGFMQLATQVSTQQLTQNACFLPGTSVCVGGSTPGVEELVFADTVTLPGAAIDWIFSYEGCCTSSGTLNSGTSVYLEARLNNLIAPTGSSPQFQNHALPWFCLNAPSSYDFSCTDPDGDNLQYTFDPVLDVSSGSCPVTTAVAAYVMPYSASHPISSSTTTALSNSGMMTFTPNIVQTAVIKVKITAMANGGITGSVMRQNVVGIYNGIVGIDNPSTQGFEVNVASPVLNDQISFTLNSIEDRNMELKIVNTLGETIYTVGNFHNGNHTIDCSSFSKGVYFLTFKSGKEIRSEKIIKL